MFGSFHMSSRGKQQVFYSIGRSRSKMNVTLTIAISLKEKERTRKESVSQDDPEFSVIKTDMSDEMQKVAVECAASAKMQHKIDKDIAHYIKDEFDQRFGKTWHCIVGKNYGSFISHTLGNFIYFNHGNKAIMIFKTMKKR